MRRKINLPIPNPPEVSKRHQKLLAAIEKESEKLDNLQAKLKRAFRAWEKTQARIRRWQGELKKLEQP